MIPKNITKESVIKAINKINLEGIPRGRESTRYNLKYMGKLYPPKYTISLANLFVNNTELKPDDFSGGQETNIFLIKLGFEIVNFGEMPDKNKGIFKQKMESDSNINIATIVIQTEKLRPASNIDRTILLKAAIKEAGRFVDVMILPAGFYITKGKPEKLYNEIEKDIKECLQSENLSAIVCLGVDGRDGKDQIGLAISNKGIISIARKFYPTDGEINCIQIADNYLSTENNYSRIFEIKGKKLYLAICYDGYGIRKQNLSNPGVYAILNLVHRFNPQGYGGSGEVYFAKYSFAGSSRQWKCPTFGSATFYGRDIPEKWPTAVLWNQGDKNVQQWRYTDNKINSINQIETSWKNEKAKIKVYSL